ncbi:MAG: hypothetical protein AAF657_26550 [Acidobacteriota bacterium]
MLVIISDIHLTDGLSGETIQKDAFLTLRQRIKNLAYEASWRSGGTWTYEPIEEMHILMLGDILDIIRSPSWLAAGAEPRPWSDPKSPEFIAKVKEINDGILKENAASLKILKEFQGEKPLTVSKRGRHKEEDPQPIKVHIHYMIGNHDWFYHLPGPEYDEIRKSVVDAIGLDNDPSEPFPHDPYNETTRSAQAIRKVLEDHGVCARHGDIYDPFNYEAEHGRNASSLGDAIVVELLGRFPDEVNKALGDELPKETRDAFLELDNVKPYAVIPGWINGLLARTVSQKSLQDEVKRIWDRVADDFLQVDFVRAHDKPWRFDIVDGLQAGLKLAGGFSLEKIGNLALKYYKKAGNTEESYYKSALEEEHFRNGAAQFVVYGHTHDYEVVPLVREHDSHFHHNLYINSGTWRRVHKIARNDPDSLQFYGYDVMTYLAFFRGDERRGKQFETWSGALGVSEE